MRNISKSMRRVLLTLATVLAMIGAVSCGTPKDITYLQGFENGDIQKVQAPVRITVQPDDKLAIVVSSRVPSMAEVFNKSVAQYMVGGRDGGRLTVSFTVNPDGTIDYPMLGKIYVMGQTRQEVAKTVEDAILKSELLKDPIVTVDFMNASVSVLGDVNQPGQYSIDRDNMTIFQALAKAGDLALTGDRTNVLVVREQDGSDVAYRLDLTDSKAVMESPVYYIRQNDVIYIEPNNMRKRQSTELGNIFYTPTFWISVVTSLTSLALVIFR